MMKSSFFPSTSHIQELHAQHTMVCKGLRSPRSPMWDDVLKGLLKGFIKEVLKEKRERKKILKIKLGFQERKKI